MTEKFNNKPPLVPPSYEGGMKGFNTRVFEINLKFSYTKNPDGGLSS